MEAIIKTFFNLVLICLIFLSCSVNEPEEPKYRISAKIKYGGVSSYNLSVKVYLNGVYEGEIKDSLWKLIRHAKRGSYTLHFITQPNIANEIVQKIYLDRDVNLLHTLKSRQKIPLRGEVTDGIKGIPNVSVLVWDDVYSRKDYPQKTITDKNGFFEINVMQGGNQILLDKYNLESIQEYVFNDGIETHQYKRKIFDTNELGDYFPLIEGKQFKYKYYYHFFHPTASDYPNSLIIDATMYCKIVKNNSIYYLDTKIEGWNYGCLPNRSIDSTTRAEYKFEGLIKIDAVEENLFLIKFPNIDLNIQRYFPADSGEEIKYNEYTILKRDFGMKSFKYYYSSPSTYALYHIEINLIE